MRAVILFCVSACVVYGQDINVIRNMPKYDARYDYLEVDAVLDSKRLVRNYVDCLINVRPCTPEGKALKRILPEALRTKCARCTDKQKRTAVKIIRRLKYEYPEEWAKLSVRWDPTGDFTRYFEEYLANEDFNTISNTANDYPSSVQPLPARPRPTFTSPPRTQPPPSSTTEGTTTPRAIALNRFSDEGELVVGSASGPAAPPKAPSVPPSTKPTPIATPRPTRPTQMTWAGAASDVFSTRFPIRPTNDMPPVYTTAMTLIDQIGYKIIRTTELVTDILRNTVRAVVG